MAQDQRLERPPVAVLRLGDQLGILSLISGEFSKWIGHGLDPVPMRPIHFTSNDQPSGTGGTSRTQFRVHFIKRS